MFMSSSTRIIGLALLSLSFLASGARPAVGQVTQRVSLSSSSEQAYGPCYLSGYGGGKVSNDGRYVLFGSTAGNLVPGDGVGADVFVRDRVLGTTEIESIRTDGGHGNGPSGVQCICMSGDARFVLFESLATNLVPGDTNNTQDLFLRDRAAGTTERVGVSTSGQQPFGSTPAVSFSVSSDGRFVAFDSIASNLVPGDTNAKIDVFLRDRRTGTTERISLGSGGIEGNGDSEAPSVSDDGRYVAFLSAATNLVPGDTNGKVDVFVRDRLHATTTRVNLSATGVQANDRSNTPVISGDGTYVVFSSVANNLVPGDTGFFDDIFGVDLRAGEIERISSGSNGQAGNGISLFPAVSFDGKLVVFQSTAQNLVPLASSGPTCDIYLRDRRSGTTVIEDLRTDGSESAVPMSTLPTISRDGRYVGFVSSSRDLVTGDSNGCWDVFLHDRQSAGFESICVPSKDGVLSCPCANPSTTRAGGCDNSSASGGGVLSASGIAYLSIDSLVFRASGEPSTASSTLFEGSRLAAGGTIYGQGVRCVGGTLTRLFTRSTVGGNLVLPDATAGDPPVSTRSAAKGVRIVPGRPYFYFVAYRDPIVLGGCPASSTFNATQAGKVTWWP